MKLPFFQHIGIGLHITDYAIRWVALSRIGDKLRIQSAYTQEIGGKSFETSLQSLVQRVKPTYKYVTVNINSSQVKQQLISLPRFDDQDYFDNWLQEQTDQLIPDGLNPEEFIVKNHIIGTGDQQHCLFAVVRREKVLHQVQMIEKAGLKPVACTVGNLQAAYGHLFDEAFTTGESWFLHLFEDSACLQTYRDGIQENLVTLSSSDGTLTAGFQEVETYMLTRQQSNGRSMHNVEIHTAVSDYFGSDLGRAASTEGAAYAIHHVSPLSQVVSKEQTLTGDDAIAAGMAVRQLYPSLDTINFLDAESQEQAQEAVQKKDALHTGIFLGGAIVLLFIFLKAMQFYLESSLAEANQQVTQLEDKISAIAEARDNVVAMDKRVTQARSLVTERTNVARLMEEVGKMVPEEVWLNEIKFYTTSGQKEIAVYGFAHHDALIASFMEQLETGKMIKNVRLIVSEKVEANDIYDKADFEQATLMQFEMRMSTL